MAAPIAIARPVSKAPRPNLASCGTSALSGPVYSGLRSCSAASMSLLNSACSRSRSRSANELPLKNSSISPKPFLKVSTERLRNSFVRAVLLSIFSSVTLACISSMVTSSSVIVAIRFYPLRESSSSSQSLRKFLLLLVAGAGRCGGGGVDAGGSTATPAIFS